MNDTHLTPIPSHLDDDGTVILGQNGEKLCTSELITTILILIHIHQESCEG